MLVKLIWPLVAVMLALLWLGQWALFGFDWGQIGLGVLTGCMLALWAMEMTGGEVPESWRRKTPRDR